MLEFENLKFRLLESEKPIENLKEALAIDLVKSEIAELDKKAAAPDFWDNMEESRKH